MRDDSVEIKARAASLDELIASLIPAYIQPVPSKETLRTLFDRENVPRFKSNPSAKRGGGTVFYSVSAVEKVFRSRMMTCRIRSAPTP